MKARRIPILMYHQIDKAPPKGAALRGLVVSPRTFFSHMAALWLLGYRGCSMSELEPYLRGEKRGKVFGITFDDGYQNNLIHALPVLQRFGFSSTCYFVARLVGKSNTWDIEKGVMQTPLMTAMDMETWVSAGQEVGSHACTHTDLAQLTGDEAMLEIECSKSELESMIQQNNGVRHFCYPYGAYTESTVKAVRQAGYVTATTTVRGRVFSSGVDSQLFELPRVLVSRTTTWFHLLLKCLTGYEDRRAGGAQRGEKAY